MTQDQERNHIPDWLNDERTVEWMEGHLPELKQSISGPRLLYQSLVVGFVVGLAAHVGGYFLLLSAPREPLGLLADLLHALGWSLWTGVVVAVFVEVIPAVKRRQFKQVVDAYEALRRKQGEGDKTVTGKPHAKGVERGQGQKRKRTVAQKENKS